MKAFSSFIFAVLLGAMFVSLFHMSTVMDMADSMSGCPYMTHEAVLCPMNLLDHIEAWKASFASIVPMLFTLWGCLIITFVIVSVAPHLVGKVRLWLLKVPIYRDQGHLYDFIVRPLQELFSRGILHPKLFSLPFSLLAN